MDTEDITGKPIVVALFDYKGATDEELNFFEGELFYVLDDENTDWWLVQSVNEPEKEGFLPSNYVKQHTTAEVQANADQSKTDQIATERETSRSRNSVRLAVDISAGSIKVQTPFSPFPEMELPSATVNYREDLKVFGTFPPSFRMSTLGKLKNEGSGSSHDFLLPVLNVNGIGFKNLFVDGRKKKVRRKTTQCAMAFSMMEVKNVPMPSDDVNVLGRQVRMSIFDKTTVMSNIHTVPVIYNPESPKLWKFSTKASLLFPRDDENTCFVRANEHEFNTCILFELCVLCSKNVLRDGTTSTVYGEISCGWGLLPLFTAEGDPIENRSYDIRLFGGTPYEKDIWLVDPVEKKGIMSSLFTGDKIPKISIKVWKLGKTALNDINQLPETLIFFLSGVPALVAYRHALADQLLTTQNDAKLYTKFSPDLVLIPQIVDQVDLFKILIMQWDQILKASKRSERKTPEIMRKKFLEAVVAIWAMVKISEIPDYLNGDSGRMQLRSKYFAKIYADGLVATLTCNPSKLSYEPFDMEELRFDYLSAVIEASG